MKEVVIRAAKKKMLFMSSLDREEVAIRKQKFLERSLASVCRCPLRGVLDSTAAARAHIQA